MNKCPICLEAGGTERAPCGYHHDNAFHAHCLDTLCEAGGTRCPHCNVNSHAIGLRRMRMLLEEWMETVGKDSSFVTFQQGLMHGECEEKALCDAVSQVVSAMQKKNSKVIFIKERRSIRNFSMKNTSGATTTVTLQRSATVFNGCLSACKDGYILTAIRKRR